MSHIDTSAEACERFSDVIECALAPDAAAALIRALVRERDEARERALDEAAQACKGPRSAAAILALKGPKP